MPPAHNLFVDEWRVARDVIAGERAIKAAGEKYLPRLDSQSDAEYAAYKTRAAWFGASATALAKYLDAVFRRSPTASVPAALEPLLADCDLTGTPFSAYARLVLTEVLSVGRGGTLVQLINNRPVLTFYPAECILDWTVTTIDGIPTLTHLLLQQPDGSQTPIALPSAKPQSTSNLDLRTSDFPPSSEIHSTSDFDLRTSDFPDGSAFCLLPSAFLFHGPSHSRPDPEPLPLADLISANLDHYRLDADYKHGLHFTALPTAWVSGFESSTPLRIGASTAWVSEVPGASAGFLEFSGAGLAYLERALERAEQRMASLTARLLERRASTDDSSRPAASCGLASIVASVNHSLTKVLRCAASLLPDPPAAESISFAMNTDLLSGPLPAAEVAALVQAWKAGAISRDSLLEKLRKGDILPDGRSIAEERALIHGVRGAG